MHCMCKYIFVANPLTLHSNKKHRKYIKNSRFYPIAGYAIFDIYIILSSFIYLILFIGCVYLSHYLFQYLKAIAHRYVGSISSGSVVKFKKTVGYLVLFNLP